MAPKELRLLYKEKKKKNSEERRCYRFADMHVCDLRRAKEFSLTYPEERKIGF